MRHVFEHNFYVLLGRFPTVLQITSILTKRIYFMGAAPKFYGSSEICSVVYIVLLQNNMLIKFTYYLAREHNIYKKRK